MRIEVENLDRAGKEFSHRYASGELTLEDERIRFAEQVSLSGRATRKGVEVQLRGKINTRVEVACDRCHRDVSFSISTDFDVKYVPAQNDDVSETAELGADDLDASVYEDGWVDADELVREQVLLSVPMRLLCQDECKGLCAGCGADLNSETCSCRQDEIDPRWAALAALKEKNG
ncbi:MAG: DUF177 domain-containing protein [Pyrinomonadaceae bacterium]|nr:DUF177 domain-containing protein [Pyrinomonadaceae bacterium]